MQRNAKQYKAIQWFGRSTPTLIPLTRPTAKGIELVYKASVALLPEMSTQHLGMSSRESLERGHSECTLARRCLLRRCAIAVNVHALCVLLLGEPCEGENVGMLCKVPPIRAEHVAPVHRL